MYFFEKRCASMMYIPKDPFATRSAAPRRGHPGLQPEVSGGHSGGLLRLKGHRLAMGDGKDLKQRLYKRADAMKLVNDDLPATIEGAVQVMLRRKTGNAYY